MRAKWIVVMVVVVVLEIVFLGMLNTSYRQNAVSELSRLGRFGLSFDPDIESCQDWLEREDRVVYSRDFLVDPIVVSSAEEDDWSTCDVGCFFRNGFSLERKADAALGLHDDSGTISVLQSMESSQYFPENNIDVAKGRGYQVRMTTSLSSDVPVGYFSWAEYDIMASPQPKTEKALAAAFISNCGGHNFRLQALEQLQRHSVAIDSYGACLHNRDDNGMQS
eukprot:Gb_12453 [translate_table: standard]